MHLRPHTVSSRRACAAVSALALALGLASCGAGVEVVPSPTATPTVTIAPATGPVVEGDGYSFSLPAEWVELDSATMADVIGSTAPESNEGAIEGVDTVAADQTDTDGFTDHVTVSLSATATGELEAIERDAVHALEDVGALDLAIKDRLTVAGGEAGHVTSTLTVDGVTHRSEQYYLQHDEQIYAVTFAFSTDVRVADRTGLAESVFATWRWN